MKTITLLGATGTIGANTIDVIRQNKAQYRLYAVTANQNVKRMLTICREFEPEFAVLVDSDSAEQLARQLKKTAVKTEVRSGVDALVDLAGSKSVDIVVAAIVGAAGLMPTLAAVRAGKRLLLANKEALVMSGWIFMRAVEEHGAQLLPVDSEHNAVFQCLPNQPYGKLSELGVTKIHLTASGGPFWQTPVADLGKVTVEQACAHPNWVMGQKISVDCATMMNKGLEVIEASWLFHADPDDINVLVHPQSIVHSMVEYADGSFLAQLGNPDMRTPIAHALAWPERIESGVKPLDLVNLSGLHFESPDYARFPCLSLAQQALKRGGTSSTILNAANEEAVTAFVAGKIGFTDIVKYIEKTMEEVTPMEATELETIVEQDLLARSVFTDIVAKHSDTEDKYYG